MRRISDITLVNTTYREKTILKELDLYNVPWEDGSMHQAFIILLILIVMLQICIQHLVVVYH